MKKHKIDPLLDAAIADLRQCALEADTCHITCKYRDTDINKEPCRSCLAAEERGTRWEWRNTLPEGKPCASD